MIEPEPGLRYSFHDLTREYAAGQAAATYPDAASSLAFQAEAYRALLTLTRRAHAALYDGDFEVVHSEVPDWDAPPAVLAEVTASPRDWFGIERPNIRAAVMHCAELGLTEICWDLAASAHEFYTLGEHFDDWQATHAAALDACKHSGDRRGEGVVLACFGQAALVASRRAGVSGVAELERAVELLTECGDVHGLAIAQRTLASALRRKSQLTRPLALLDQAQAGYEAAGDTLGRWQAMRFIGQTHLGRGQPAEALVALRAAQLVADELGRGRLDAQNSYWIGQASLSVGDLEAARVAFATVGAVYADGADVGRAYALHGFGDLALRAGRLDDAQEFYGQAAELAGGGADAVLEGRIILSVAELCGAQGRRKERRAALDRAVACFEACGAAQLQARALAAMAGAQQEDGDGSDAAATRALIEELYESLDVPGRGQDLPRLGPQQWRAQEPCIAAPVEHGRPAGFRRTLAAGRLDEVLAAQHLAAEVARVKLGAPDDLVDVAQLAHGELRLAEGGRQGGEFQLRASACLTAFFRMSSWSYASVPSTSSTGAHLALRASLPAVGIGRSGAIAR